MSGRNRLSFLLVVTMLSLLLSGWGCAATGAIPAPTATSGAFIPFDVFLQCVERATFDEYARLLGAQVQDAQTFEEMCAYIQRLYAGVRRASSFVSEGQYVDCITITSQPSGRQLDLTTLALNLGFSSHSHFSAVFRRAFGLTPSQFREATRRGLSLRPH
jgi:AraC-like DNA-binding protein